MTKREYTFKDFLSIYNAEILNCFNSELQLSNTESAIKRKLIDLLTQLKRFKFVTELVLVFKRIENGVKIKFGNFYSS